MAGSGWHAITALSFDIEISQEALVSFFYERPSFDIETFLLSVFFLIFDGCLGVSTSVALEFRYRNLWRKNGLTHPLIELRARQQALVGQVSISKLL